MESTNKLRNMLTVFTLLTGLLLIHTHAAIIRRSADEALAPSRTQSLPPAKKENQNIAVEGIILPKPALPPLEVQTLDDGIDGILNIFRDEKEDAVENDIIKPPPALPPTGAAERRKKRKVDGDGWPQNVVPYEYSSNYRSYSSGIKTMIEQAMQWWEDATCIRFRPASSSDRVRLSYSNDGGCRSYVGYQPDIRGGIQEIKLQDSQCFSTIGTAAHEIGHALGLIHEQSRIDRDDHIDIHVDRINEASLHNFQIYYSSRVPSGVKYDLNSIMHYKPNIFSAMPFLNLPTMTAKNPKKDVLMGQRDALGYYDVKAINVEYCQGSCQDNCLNDGYVIYKDNACRCVCPEGLSGRRCEQVATSCGGVINLGANSEQVFTSPDSYSGKKCVWLINAPSGFLVEVNFDSLDISQARTSESSCAHTVEVRNNILGQRGDIYCGTGPLGPFNTMLDYKNHQMMVVLDATDTRVSAGSGFSATVRAYKDACLSDPCINGGVCNAIGSSDYSCNCPTGYQGKNCDRVKDAAVECDFGNNFCNFRNDKQDQLDLQRMFTSNKYLEVITRTSNGNKFFVGAPVEFQTGLGDKANLISPIFSSSVVPKRCLKFNYHMAGSYQGQGVLKAIVRSVSGNENVVFSVQGSQGNGWKTAEKELTSNSDYEVVLSIQSSNQYPYNSLIALDDVSILPQSCSGPCSRNPCPIQGSICVEPSSGGYYCVCPPGKAGNNCDKYDTDGFTCSFDSNDNCGWRNDVRTTYDFLKGYGTADAQQRTGPVAGVGGRGSYMNADTSSSGAGPGKEARMESVSLDGSGQMCAEFYYHMHGSSMGSLKLRLKSNGQLNNAVWTKSGDQGKDWNFASADFSVPSGNTQLVFEASSGPRHLSDIAVDEIKISRGRCNSGGGQNSATARAQVTTPRPETTTTEAPQQPFGNLERKLGNGEVLAECNFERGLCTDNLVYLPSINNRVWTRTNEATPSSGTGPNYAAEGAYFIFTEASDGETGEKHTVSTHLLYNSDGKACINFYYHMSGDGTGSLEVVQKRERGPANTVWSKSGEQGDEWQRAQIDINMGGAFYQILFESTVGSNYRGDIALDGIKIVRGTCEAYNQKQARNVQEQTSISLTCDFEAGHICAPSFRQKSNDDFDWQVQTGPTPSARTGPDGAASGSKYLYIEASEKPAKQKAIFESDTVPANIGNVCLKLYYHMRGQGMGKFTIYKVTNGVRSSIFSRQGEQSDSWQLLQKTLPNSAKQYTLEFEAELGSSNLRYYGDIAVDNVSLTSGNC